MLFLAGKDNVKPFRGSFLGKSLPLLIYYRDIRLNSRPILRRERRHAVEGIGQRGSIPACAGKPVPAGGLQPVQGVEDRPVIYFDSDHCL